MTKDPLARAVKRTLMEQAFPAPARTRGPGSNVDRLVAAASELLRRFGGGAFAGMAESQIRSHVSEAGGREALARLHELTAPPYR